MSDNYLPRIIDQELAERLEAMGAVLIVGPKWCGKTTTAVQQAKSVLFMQDPDKIKGYLSTAQTKPSLLLIGENPRLIDEWQVAPVLWDAIRMEVDLRSQDGLFILTGSTSVNDKEIMHSGTGRISRLKMYPLSLFESNESNGTISLKNLFENKKFPIDGIKSQLKVESLIFAACRGGWPSSLSKKTEKAKLFVASSYLDNICENDISTVDGVKKDPHRVRALLRSYARNISTLATNRTILKDLNANYGEMSESSLYAYLGALQRLFVIEDIPAWSPSIRSATSVRSSSKKSFIDPSIAVAALDLSPSSLLQDLNTFGFIFENLCIRDLKIYSNALGGQLSYFHDRYGLETDAVLHLRNGKYALIECKLGSQEIEEAADHLVQLQKLIQDQNKVANVKIQEPEFLMVLTGGEMAFTRPDGVKIVPIGCLRD